MQEWKEIGAMLGAALLMVGLLLGGLWLASRQQCLSKWRDSGMEPTYRTFEGCRIRLPDGRRIPSSNYREM